MSNLTQITDKLWSLSIPAKAIKIEDTYADGVMWEVGGDYDSFYFEGEIQYPYTILGTVDLESISFDCRQYCGVIDEINRGHFIEVIYKDYVGDMVYYYSYQKSFRSLLKSKGIEPTAETKILILEKK